jgi:hypothetical protein
MRLTGKPSRVFEKPGDLYPGAKIKFEREKQAYKVICDSKRFTILTKPLNIHHTVLYTIIDWQEQVRGAENIIFGMGAETREQCLEMLVRLLDGESEVSYRNRIWLDIEKIWHDDHIMFGEGAESFKDYIDRKTAKGKKQ